MNLPRRVALRYLQARTTRQYDKLESLLTVMEKPLRSAVGSFSRWRSEPISDATASELARSARDVLTYLNLSFENPQLQEKAKTYLTRIKNLTKMISEWAASPTSEDLTKVLKKQDTKSKNPWQKYMEYREEVLGIIKFFDTEIENVMMVESFNVALMTSARDEWDEKKVSKTRWVLERGSKILTQAGFGKFAQGKILAYPSVTVPGEGRGTLAYYSKSSHIMALAVGGDPQRILKTLVHEYGHKVYYEGLGNRGRLMWADFFEASQGVPDVDSIIRTWEAGIAQSSSSEVQKYGRYAGYYLPLLNEANPEIGAWAQIVIDKLDIKEEFNPVTGQPKKGSVPALDQIIARKGEVTAFLYPVTAYSATSASELFAEVFAYYLALGPSAIPEIVRDQFRRAVPMLKKSSQAFIPRR